MTRTYDIKRREEGIKRRERLLKMLQEGMTYQEIADHEGISRQRAHQILLGYGQ